MKFNLLHPADQIVMIMERIYGYGMTTTSGGNLSIIDSNGDIWISPGGIDKGSLKRQDIVQVKPDGTIIGAHNPSSELPFHLSVYKMRPDVKAIVHAHPPALVAFSLVRKIPNTALIPNARLICGDIALAPYDLPGSQQLGDKIGAEFEKGFNTVMLENHGVVIGADTLFKAFKRFETLDFLARLEVESKYVGEPRSISEKNLQIYKERQLDQMEEFEVEEYTSEERLYRDEMCRLIKRAYNQQLFTSTQGTFSRRLSDGSFIITPYNKDRKYLEPEDIVKIADRKKEKGKIPSRSVKLHDAIYKEHPDINSVIIAHPPNIMAFAVTDAEFDARTIPESYILLKTVKRLPFGSSFLQSKLTSKEINTKNPVAIVENDCVIVAGSDLLNAFDRLEVLEYTARGVIYTKKLGEIVKISSEQIKEIEIAFKL